MDLVGSGTELRVNGATMREIAQMWINASIMGEATVEKVEYLGSPNIIFVIHLKPTPKPDDVEKT